MMARKPSRRPERKRKQDTESGPGIPAANNVRLNRFLAMSGVCSRRKADEMIKAGLVRINGDVVSQLGTRVSAGDKVVVNGKLISPTKHTHILLNKPRDTITTTSDDRGRATVLDLVTIAGKEDMGLFPVGRLDRNTTGVLLITNDGELANRLMHPRYEIEKLYVVRADRPVEEVDIERLRSGVDLDGELVQADQVTFADPADRHIVGISLHEGRNRQIRRMMEALGYEVKKLERVRYAGLTTSRLRRGRWRTLEPFEVEGLYRKVKLKTK